MEDRIAARIEAMAEDIREIRDLLRQMNGRLRESERSIAVLQEAQRRQDDEVRHLRARDWAAGIIASIIAAILAALPELFRK